MLCTVSRFPPIWRQIQIDQPLHNQDTDLYIQTSYSEIPDVDQGFLSCHPGGLTDPKALNIAGERLRYFSLLQISAF